jgi:hypothetical protein
MQYYLQKVQEVCDNLQVLSTLGTRDCFMVDSQSKELVKKEQKIFHTMVARFLYLSKRARPEILAVVGFLCTRVKRPTLKDRKKLETLLGYLKGAMERIMVIKLKSMFKPVGYVDASFAAHPNGRSHSGVIMQVAGASVFFGSRKQKRVRKSPTEAELAASSDNLGFMELFV